MPTLIDLLEKKKPQIAGPSGLFKKKAHQQLKALGLPSKKDGAFQYMPLLKLLQDDLQDSEKTLCEAGDVFFHNGCLVHAAHTECEMLPLGDAFTKYSAYLNHAAAGILKRETNPFALAASALCEEGVFIYVPPGKQFENPITIASQVDTSVAFHKVHILVGKGSKVTIEVDGPVQEEGTFHEFLIEGSVEMGGELSIVSKGKSAHQGYYLESVRINQKRDSKSTYYAESVGGKASRYDAVVTLAEENAETTIEGVHELRDKNQAHTHLLVHHKAPNCRSYQHVKNGLFDSAVSSFEGKIYVEKEAQQTDAYQLNNNLVLGEKARAYSKPNLEIFADDVSASHGSTTGQLSEEELFYLQTRGLVKSEAETLLVRAFFDEIRGKYVR